MYLLCECDLVGLLFLKVYLLHHLEHQQNNYCLFQNQQQIYFLSLVYYSVHYIIPNQILFHLKHLTQLNLMPLSI